MLTLPAIRTLRSLHGLTAGQLSSLTGIEPDRLRQIEKGSHEALLHEAHAIHRILGTDTILVLTDRHNLDACLPNPPMPPAYARQAWLEGRQLPISVAFVLTKALGLDDPCQLAASPLHAQIWDVLRTSERLGDTRCPWCLADAAVGEPHHDLCLPANLWPARDTRGPIGRDPVWLRPESRSDRYGRSMPARGLRAIRERSGKSQIQVAHDLGLSSQGAISALEHCKRPLTITYAKRFAMYFGCTEAELYAEPSTLDNPTATDKPISLDDHREYIQALEAATQQTK